MQTKKPNLLSSGLLCLCGSVLVSSTAFAQAASEAPKAGAGGAKPTPAAAAPAAAPAPAPATPAGGAPAAAAPAAGDSAAASSEATPSPEVLAEAKQRFDRGYELYDEGEYSLALIEFTRAYELVPNYRVLYNIGQVNIQLGQYANARRALKEYMEKGGDELSNDRRTSVAKDLEMLDRRTAFLMITSNVTGAEVLVDDVVVGKTPLEAPLLVDAGVHRVTLRRSGYQQKTNRIILAGGDEQSVPFPLEAVQEGKQTIVVRERAQQDGYQTLMIAGWATTGALAAGAIITGIMGASEAKELEDLRKSDPTEISDFESRLDRTKSRASSLLLASDVFSGAAIVTGGLSLWLTIAPPKSDDDEPAPSPTPPPPGQPGVQVGYQDGLVQVRGQF
jgi:tetratricopeptide (TPR) repeat protein